MPRPSTRTSRVQCAAVATALFTAVLLCAAYSGRLPGGAGDAASAGASALGVLALLPARAAAAPGCGLEFQKYVPSGWEAQWLAQRQKLAGSVCAAMLQQKELTFRWARGAAALLAPNATVDAQLLGGLLADAEVWSRFEYTDTCSGRPVAIPIEPLVGLLRHPTAHRDCRVPDMDWTIEKAHDRPGCGSEHIENKGYMAVAPLPPARIAVQYPGRRYLFDLGSGLYSSGSLSWLLRIYERRGLTFDEVWGWEVTQTPAAKYWAEWPPAEIHKMHWFNTPFDTNASSPAHPLAILKRVYRPGDFVAIKLDIDTEALELEFMRQIGEQGLGGAVAEIFWEQHYNNAHMERYFHYTMQANWTDSIELFSRYRSQGWRLHYWP